MNAFPPAVPLSAIEKRYTQLLRRAQHLPPAGSRPLTVSGRVAGWITSRATHAIQSLPGVEVNLEAVHVSAVPAKRLRIDTVLEQLAVTLNEAGCVRAWRGELLDVVGEGRRLGAIERGAVRPLGMLTRAVHLNAWRPDGRLLIARRSLSKTTDPGLWDTLVGGLAAAGESLDDSLLRESEEEAGLLPQHLAGRSPLRTILRMHRRLPEGYQVEDVLVSECVLDAQVQPRNMDGEVDRIEAVTLEEAWELATDGAFTLEAELVILDCLRQRLSVR